MLDRGEAKMGDAIVAAADTQSAESVEQQPEGVTIISLLMGILIHPRATFKNLKETKNGYWWLIFALTIIGVILYTVISASITARAFQSFVPPAGAAASATNAAGAAGAAGTTTRQFTQASSLITYGVPLISAIVMILLGYGLRSLVAFGASLVLGGHSTFKQTFRMAVWTTIPAFFRYVVQSVAVASTSGRIISGLSGVMTTIEARSLPFLNTLLGQVDIYSVWSMILLGIGITVTTKLSKGKSLVAVLIYIAVAVLGLLIFYEISTALGGLTGGQRVPGGFGGFSGRRGG
jgi:hypothetical protein